MFLIAITQRVSLDTPTKERRDVLDQRWTRLLEALKAKPLLIPNRIAHVERFLDTFKINGIILTGGNDLAFLRTLDSAPERDALEKRLIAYGIRRGLPMVGICRGMQMFGSYFGIKPIRIPGHSRIIHGITLLSSSPLYRHFRNVRSVNSYHCYGIRAEDAQRHFEIFARCGSFAEGIRHPRYAVVGIMWHPERMKPFRKADLAFFKSALRL